MDLNIMSLIIIGIFLQSIVQVIKPLYDPEAKRFAIPEIISVCAGIIVGIIGEVNLLEGIFAPDSLVALYLLYAISGICLGRGGSLVHDIFNKMRNFNVDKAIQSAEMAEQLANVFKNLFGVEIVENAKEDEIEKIDNDLAV